MRTPLLTTPLVILSAALLATGCLTSAPLEEDVIVARLAEGSGDALEEIRRAFQSNNPGYDLAFESGVAKLEAAQNEQYKAGFKDVMQ